MNIYWKGKRKFICTAIIPFDHAETKKIVRVVSLQFSVLDGINLESVGTTLSTASNTRSIFHASDLIASLLKI